MGAALRRALPLEGRADICLSHKNRMRINKWQNDLEKEQRRDKLFIASYGFV